MDKNWHVINVFEDRYECSCGRVWRGKSFAKVFKKAMLHGKATAPSVTISRRGCSDLCIEERMIRDMMVTFHDMACPNHMQNKKEKNAT